MYDVWVRRTNVYLDDRQLHLLRSLGVQRGQPVAGLVRTAVDEWLTRQGARELPADEWQARFDALLHRRASAAEQADLDPQTVEADVTAAVNEVRTGQARARRR
jgi:hypothetical protein